MPSQHHATGNDGCRLIVICLPSLLHWVNGWEGKQRDCGRNEKPGKTRMKGDAEMSWRREVWCKAWMWALCSILFCRLSLGPPVLFHHSPRHTHTCTSSSPPTPWNSCHCLRSQKQTSDRRANRPRRHYDLTGTNSQNNPQLRSLFLGISRECSSGQSGAEINPCLEAKFTASFVVKGKPCHV